jgi:hypothetical protein
MLPQEDSYRPRKFTFLNGIEYSEKTFPEQSQSRRLVQRRRTMGSAVAPLNRGTSCEYQDLKFKGVPLVWTNFKTGQHHVLWREIDGLCRWIFPVTFICLCLVYWTVLFIHSKLNSPSLKQHSYCS